MNCKQQLVTEYLTDKLEGDSLLEFLLHLDDCEKCWNEIYEARKAEHLQYYIWVKPRSVRRIPKKAAS
jgi:hypothetical protein